MDTSSFRKHGHEIVDWIADYFEQIEEFPVKSRVKPGEIRGKLPDTPPREPEPFNTIFSDFREIILPGITHWQHPRFMGYFPANNSKPSVLGEFLTAALGAQCMSWQTSPAATELEEQVMEWLRQMIGLPESFTGVIQDTASTSTLVALLMARESNTNFATNEEGFSSQKPLSVYGSTETHSSIEKGAKIAGYGRQYIRKVPVDKEYSLKPDQLEKAIREDQKNGIHPTCVVATLGTTGSTAIDPLPEIAEICRKYDLWLHVDAAFAGTALLLKEMRWISRGIEHADSFVFNPHKWMFTNFDCSAFYVQDKDLLLNTFRILPEYLKTREDEEVTNYRDWGIQLGRRFRALKLWFVIRNFGVEGLKQRIRHHLELTQTITEEIDQSPNFERMAPIPLNTICFRYHPDSIDNERALNRINSQLLEQLQDSGEVFLTHTTLDGAYVIRLVIGQTNVGEEDVNKAWRLIRETADKLK